MSQVIYGSKSVDYNKAEIPGIPNSGDTLEHVSVQHVSGKRGAVDTIIHGVADVSFNHIVEVGSVKRLIKSTAHGAMKGWVMIPTSGAAEYQEISIIEVIDADTFVISTEFPLAIADTFDLKRYVTAKYGPDGSLTVITTTAPTQYVLNSVDQQVIEDDIDPTNNRAFPSAMFIQIDGISYPIHKDTVTPSNTVSVPVEITGASGPINITAGDLNVQLSDQGPNADVTRLGDGVNQWGFNALNEGLTHDEDLLTELKLKANLLDTQPVSLASTPLPADASTQSKQDAIIAELELKANLTDTQPVSLLSIPLPSDASTESKQDDIISELQSIKNAEEAANLLLTSVDSSLNDLSLTSAAVNSPAPAKVQMAGYVDKNGNVQPALVTENDAVAVGNFIQKFRDGFVNASPDLTVWDESWTNQSTGFVSNGGNAAGSSFLKVSMCPLTEDSEYNLISKRSFKFPVRFAYGLSASQKILGQWFDVSLVGVDSLGNIEESASKSDLNILGNIVIASNIATVNFATAHGLNGGDRVVLYGNTDSRLNVGPVIVTVVTATQITVPCTATSGTLTAGGVVKWANPLGLVSNAVGVLYETTSATTAAFVARRNGAKFRYLSTSMSSTIATQSNTSPYTEAFNAAGDMEIVTSMDDVVYYARSSDSISAASYTGRFSQGLPDEEKEYKIRLRARNSFGYTVPVAKIVTISKSGSTTATVTTDVPHGLTVANYVQVYGVRDIVGFPNLTAQTIVSSVISATQFTVIIGSSATVTSNGGGVWKVQGSTLAPGAYAQNIQSIARTNNVMTVTFNTTVSTTLPGETVHIYGCNATTMGLYDGAYKVLRASTTILELESVGADFTSIVCGGALIKRTDVRLHYVRIADYTRHSVEVSNARGGLDAARSMPVTGAVTVSSGTITSASVTGTITNIQRAIGTTAVRATVSGTALTSTNKKRRFKPSVNNTGRIFIGSSTVTTSNGFEIVGPDTYILDGDYSDYHLISDTAGQVVEILEAT